MVATPTTPAERATPDVTDPAVTAGTDPAVDTPDSLIAHQVSSSVSGAMAAGTGWKAARVHF